MSQLNTQDVRNLLEAVQTACAASIDAIAKTDLNGAVLWLKPPFVQCAIHETVYDRLAAVHAACGATLKVLEIENVIQPG